MLSKRSEEFGAIYVESAIVLPILLLVTFASIFFFLCAARYFSLQMLANEIARDISLGLQDPEANATGCNKLRTGKLSSNDSQEINLTTTCDDQFNNGSAGKWKLCAKDRYLLVTDPPNNKPSVNAIVHPVRNWFDAPFTSSSQLFNTASPGDFVEVTVRYPIRWVMGDTIAVMGLLPDVELIGKGVGIVEPPR